MIIDIRLQMAINGTATLAALLALVLWESSFAPVFAVLGLLNLYFFTQSFIRWRNPDRKKP